MKSKPQPFTLRLATNADRAALEALYRLSQMATNTPPSLWFPNPTLGALLYSHPCIERYVAVKAKRVIGHGALEPFSPAHPVFLSGALPPGSKYIELGCAFVHPEYFHHGIYTALLNFRLQRARRLGYLPLTCTWDYNHHLKRLFERLGGRKIQTYTGYLSGPHQLDLYLFD